MTYPHVRYAVDVIAPKSVVEDDQVLAMLKDAIADFLQKRLTADEGYCYNVTVVAR